MFDFETILELTRTEPYVQCVLLFMIWLSSRSVKKEIHQINESLEQAKVYYENRFQKIEGRITVLETKEPK